ncbi:MAG: hypothetical protein WBW41_14810 [Verrucomicrobiia bacterium]
MTLTNRRANDAADGLQNVEQAKATKIMNRAQEIVRNSRGKDKAPISLATACGLAAREIESL